MIVYAESNFVFELAFVREEVEHAERLLELAEEGRIRLAIPAFSFAEPYESLIRRARNRKSIQDQLATELEELARSRPYADVMDTSQAVTGLLAASAQEERNRLASVLERLARTADVIPLTGEVVLASLDFQTSLGLSPQDALVFASVDAHAVHAASEPKVFANKNWKDFLNPDILDRLAGFDCKLIRTFSGALGHIESVFRGGRKTD